jgi:hypothetical protein
VQLRPAARAFGEETNGRPADHDVAVRPLELEQLAERLGLRAGVVGPQVQLLQAQLVGVLEQLSIQSRCGCTSSR